ncbi:hypothetical protein [Paeniglutamicibacter sp. NPDC091659]|uniref:hypothetical protein n=1 Tax=Paeniglutamicibacter sp. NPDC091659 TaxID=3364389 RepID=UPI00380A1015
MESITELLQLFPDRIMRIQQQGHLISLVGGHEPWHVLIAGLPHVCRKHEGRGVFQVVEGVGVNGNHGRRVSGPGVFCQLEETMLKVLEARQPSDSIHARQSTTQRVCRFDPGFKESVKNMCR